MHQHPPNGPNPTDPPFLFMIPFWLPAARPADPDIHSPFRPAPRPPEGQGVSRGD